MTYVGNCKCKLFSCFVCVKTYEIQLLNYKLKFKDCEIKYNVYNITVMCVCVCARVRACVCVCV
jgi:hypothetical protein